MWMGPATSGSCSSCNRSVHGIFNSNPKKLYSTYGKKNTFFILFIFICFCFCREAGRSILRAFQKAHMKIIEGYDDVWDAGTTTLCGGIIMELVEDHETLAFLKELGISTQANQTKFSFEQESDSPSLKLKDFTVDSNQTPHTSLPPYKWIFICASVGDCKAFHYSVHTKQITDITAGNRTNLVDPKDPGGRLGPQSENGAADLRNLALYFVPCHADDLIILVSDGVHDNLDPQTLGIPPSDVGMAFDNWVDAEKADALKTDEIKNHFRAQFMRALIKSGGGTFPTLMPENVTGILVDHSTQLTMSSRKFMETYPNKRLPDDYVLYPGKMDHSTCVTLVAGGMTLQNKFGKADSAYGRIPKSNSGVAKENGTKSEDSNKASNHYDAIPKVNGNTNEPATRRLGVFDMDKELLTELSVTPTDTILTLIEAIKEDLEKVIEGRAFRLRKGDDSFSKKPIPIMKKQFTTRVYDFFPLASDIIVMQFGNVPVREPKKGGQSN
eukprot:TRINITY_DN1023_c0_g2_i2.p1 TRINITY_DN1023_c0_g2~~TRINITY_DN1023_c0_g2_i2.p1  ORF type:complete len:498 (+),score=74.96 TRINITY_DN1023_c0_g2_i2:373-1866(+)